MVPALDPALAPRAVVRWFTNPDPDLLVGGRPASPQAWLASGHDPAVAAGIAADLVEEQ